MSSRKCGCKDNYNVYFDDICIKNIQNLSMKTSLVIVLAPEQWTYDVTLLPLINLRYIASFVTPTKQKVFTSKHA